MKDVQGTCPFAEGVELDFRRGRDPVTDGESNGVVVVLMNLLKRCA